MLSFPDPKSQSDFTYILDPIPINELDPGHTCLSIADPPSAIAYGTNATIQLRYTADFDRPENQTFYACTDITYVRSADFDASAVPCFNATEDVDVPAPTSTGTPTDLPGHGDDETPQVTSTASTTPEATQGSQTSVVTLSKGAIAGAVVGAVVGFALIVGLGLLFYRERQKKMRLERQRNSARGVAWRSDDPGKDSTSAGSFRMDNMTK